MDFRANTGPYGNHSLTDRVTDRRCRCRYIHAITSIFGHHLLQQHLPKWCLSGLWRTKGNFAITMALAELAEQLQIANWKLSNVTGYTKGKS